MSSVETMRGRQMRSVPPREESVAMFTRSISASPQKAPPGRKRKVSRVLRRLLAAGLLLTDTLSSVPCMSFISRNSRLALTGYLTSVS